MPGIGGPGLNRNERVTGFQRWISRYMVYQLHTPCSAADHCHHPNRRRPCPFSRVTCFRRGSGVGRRFGRSVPVRAGMPSSPLVDTSDGTVGVNVYGVSAQIQEVFDLIDEGTQRSGVGRAPASTAPMAMC